MTEPSPQSGRDAASRVRDILRLAGGAIGVYQCILQPWLLGQQPSLPALTLAGGMMGIAQAVDWDRKRRDGDS